LTKTGGRRLASPSGALVFSPALRRIVAAAGYRCFPLWFGRFGQKLAVWGRIDASRRVLAKYAGDTQVITFEDAFLRSVLPGRKTPPLGLAIDDIGVHFDASAPSRLENILSSAPLDDADLMTRARDGRDFLRRYGLSKYNTVAKTPVPDLPDNYVLVLDQVAGDAALAGAGPKEFHAMLAAAIVENPDSQVLVRTHPATQRFADKTGHFNVADLPAGVTLFDEPCNPVALLEQATRVYCMSSQTGFEAICLGHRPVVFGAPFYAGWGLSDDRALAPETLARRGRQLGVDQLFAGAMLEFPFWFDQTTRRPCSFEVAVQQLLAEARSHWDGARPSVMLGIRQWKRASVRRFVQGAGQKTRFATTSVKAAKSARQDGAQIVAWAGRIPDGFAAECARSNLTLVRMEDGFLRSSGLGAALTPPLSLVLDDIGIYYDPRHSSRLETLIGNSMDLPPFARKRAAALRARVLSAGVTKYNLPDSAPLPDLPSDRPIVLVPGQVEDDASVRVGCSDVRTNLSLLTAARQNHPDALILYKPHPDTVAGLRQGAISPEQALEFCDHIVADQNLTALLDCSDILCTMTSLTGFEALLRGKIVECFGLPFYAGWGLTKDYGRSSPRRHGGITLDGLVHAALIDYPRYIDPVSKRPCRPELIVERLAAGQTPKPPHLRVLAKMQALLAEYAFIWRRGSRSS